MTDKRSEDQGNEIVPIFDQRRKPVGLPFKEPDQIKLVVTPEQPTIKLVTPEQPQPTAPATDAPATGTTVTAPTASSLPDHVKTNLTPQNIEQAIDASLGGPGTSTDYQTTNALKQGLAGERLAAEGLSQKGHQILDYKPDIAGTNQPGIDIVTMKDGTVYFVDNKAYGTGRNVGSVSALDKNFDKNVADVREKFDKFANDSNRTEAERGLYARAVEAITNKNYQKAVTTMAVVADGKHSGGITSGLAGKDFIYIELGPDNPNAPAASSGPAAATATGNTTPKLVVDPGTELVPTNQPGTQLTVTNQPGTQLTVTGQPGAVEPVFDSRPHASASAPARPAGDAPSAAATTPVFDQKAVELGPGPSAASPAAGPSGPSSPASPQGPGISSAPTLATESPAPASGMATGPGSGPAAPGGTGVAPGGTGIGPAAGPQSGPSSVPGSGAGGGGIGPGLRAG